MPSNATHRIPLCIVPPLQGAVLIEPLFKHLLLKLSEKYWVCSDVEHVVQSPRDYFVC